MHVEKDQQQVIILQRSKTKNPGTLGTIIMPSGNSYATLERSTMIEGTIINNSNVKSFKQRYEIGIPAGQYELIYQWSHKFNGYRWFLRNVESFTGIMIHEGNKLNETEGCILIGTIHHPQRVETLYSLTARRMFEKEMELLKNPILHIFD